MKCAKYAHILSSIISLSDIILEENKKAKRNARMHYFLEGGKRESRKRLVPQEAAVPIAPPTIALPTKIAPLTTIGANLESGSEVV